MNPPIPPVSSVITRRDALKALGSGAALLAGGLMGRIHSVCMGDEPSNPSVRGGDHESASRALSESSVDPLEPQFITRNASKLPLA